VNARTNAGWLLGGLAVPLLLVGCASTSPTPAPTPTPVPSASPAATPLPSGWSAAGPASPEVIAVLEGRIEAFNRGDFEAAAAYWAEDGALIEYEDGTIFTQGREAIAKRLAGVYEFPLRMRSAGVPLQLGRLVAQPVWWLQPGSTDSADCMLVFVMSDSNEIAAEYVTFWAPE
jgi:hypothetical protein